MSTLIQVATPTHFRHGRLEKIGFCNPWLYLALYKDGTKLELWELHSLIPNSWRRVCSIEVLELFYFYLTLSADDKRDIYALMLATFEEVKGDIHPLKIELRLARVAASDDSIEYFFIADESKEKVGGLPFQNLQLGWSEDGPYMLDRSIIRGTIPFWRIELNEAEKSFKLVEMHIPDSTSNDDKYVHFPVVIDGGERRRVLKLTAKNDLRLYDGTTQSWSKLSPSKETDLELTDIRAEGISETFGREWHRLGAVESPLSVLVNEGRCTFKIYQGGKHHFYRLNLLERSDDEGGRGGVYALRRCSSTKVSRLLQTMFYTHTSRHKVAFVSKYMVGFANMQPSSLKEVAFWGLQKPYLSLSENNQWKGGRSEEELLAMLSKLAVRDQQLTKAWME